MPELNSSLDSHMESQGILSGSNMWNPTTVPKDPLGPLTEDEHRWFQWSLRMLVALSARYDSE